jgi:hypothetical protein
MKQEREIQLLLNFADGLETSKGKRFVDKSPAGTIASPQELKSLLN